MVRYDTEAWNLNVRGCSATVWLYSSVIIFYLSAQDYTSSTIIWQIANIAITTSLTHSQDSPNGDNPDFQGYLEKKQYV